MRDARMRELTLFLCGDVMTGRGIDQILATPSRPRLYEPAVRDARDYVAMAEEAHGSIPRRAAPAYVWGTALEELARRRPAARIVNLETSLTTSEVAEPKGINYRMHPANVGVLAAAAIDCAVVANNHVLDWGRAGLAETLDTLAHAGIRTAGAGRTRESAEAPAVIGVDGVARVLVFGVGGPDCGIPEDWRAADDRAGVVRVPDYSDASADYVASLVAGARGPRDVVVVSIHWGGNWGYDVPREHRAFAHALVERAGADVVHGHSAHHAKAIEVHRGRPILYGCGDFVNDYEGIGGDRALRDDLAVMYFVTIGAATGAMTRLELVPLAIRRFRLGPPSAADRAWLRETLDRECRRFGQSIADRGERWVLAPA